MAGESSYVFYIQYCKILLPDSGKRQLEFNAQGYIILDQRDYNDSREEDTSFGRDGNNNITSVTDPLNRTVSYTYDSLANVKSVTHTPGPGTSSSATTNYTYEPVFNRIASITEPLTPATTFSYNDTSNTEIVTDPMGRTTTVNFDPVTGQITSVKDNLGNRGTFGYNSTTGDETSATDPLGNATNFTTDAIGRVTQVKSPLGGLTSYQYDAINDVLSVTDPNSSVTSYQYDLIGDKIQVTDPNNNVTTITIPVTLDTITTCDAANNCTVENLDAMGRKTTFTDKRGVKTGYTYDKLGRLITVAFNQNGVSGYDQRTLNYTYDTGDRADSISDSEGPTLGYAYDALDNILSESTSAGTVYYTYDANGRRTSMSAPTVPGGNSGNYQVNYTYFNDDQLQTVSMPGVTATFTPDGDGRRGTLAVNNVTTTYGYDAASRLKSLAYAYNSTSLGNLLYTYDKNSDVVDVGGSLARTNLPGAVSATYTNTNQVNLWNGVAAATDPASNITADPSNGESYSWDSRNMLSSLVKGGANYSNSYDATGRRLAANNAGNTTSYGYDGDALIGSVLGGATDNYLNLGGEVLADSNSSATSIPLQDGSGSTIALVNSATGALTTQYTYDPAGNVSLSGQSSSFPFLGGGAQYDSLTGLYAGEGNYYNPVLERAISMIGATSSEGGGNNPTGAPGDFPSSSSNFNFNNLNNSDARAAFDVSATFFVLSLMSFPECPACSPVFAAVGVVSAEVGGVLELLGLLGSSQPWINPKLYEPGHSIQGLILGCLEQTPLSNARLGSEGEIEDGITYVRFIVPNIPENPSDRNFDPGEGWERRPKDNWAHPGRKQGLHPHPNERMPKGPHFDWHFRPSGRRLGIKRDGTDYYFWGPDVNMSEGWLLLDEFFTDLAALPW